MTDEKDHFDLRNEQLIASQKMEALGWLSGGIAHDFNNLIMAIQGNCDFLLEACKGRAQETRDIMEIKNAANRAAALTSELLAFSRQKAMEPKLLDLNVVVRDISQILRRTLGESIELRLLLCSDECWLKADASGLGTALLNLAINARDAMKGNGRIMIRTEIANLSEPIATPTSSVPAGDYVILEISDTGCGIPTEIQTKIFEPFFTTKEPGKGTGLGLALVYATVTQMGGTVRVVSEPGEGTLFRFYFPRQSGGPLKDAPENTRVAVKGGQETILVVEDDIPVRRFTKRALESNGYKIIESGNGQEAFDVLQSSRTLPDLVLTDVIMPKMSGGELMKHVKGKWPTARLLFMSGYPQKSIEPEGVYTDGNELIEKPFSSSELLVKVREVLDRT